MLCKLNPSFKCLGVLLPALMISFRYQVYLNLSVFILCLISLFFSGVSFANLVKKLLPILITAGSIFMTGFIFAADSHSTLTESMGVNLVYPAGVIVGLQMSTRILAFAGLGLTFSLTTNMKEFISSLEQQCRLPSRFAYGILAAFHLGPLLPFEYKKTAHAFLARGQRFLLFSPKVLVPFIIKSVRWSESLAIAMESKGFNPDGTRTCLHIILVRWFDYGFIVFSVGLTLTGMFLLP